MERLFAAPFETGRRSNEIRELVGTTSARSNQRRKLCSNSSLVVDVDRSRSVTGFALATH